MYSLALPSNNAAYKMDTSIAAPLVIPKPYSQLTREHIDATNRDYAIMTVWLVDHPKITLKCNVAELGLPNLHMQLLVFCNRLLSRHLSPLEDVACAA